VWALYEHAIRRVGAVSTLVEWDDEIPSWEVLAEEARMARATRARVLAAGANAGEEAPCPPG
jgi:uncharacterized protein (UPF0276 family)